MTLVETAQLMGNFGEFVGAIAVVVTLAYLAVQVRHGREATQINTNQLKGEAIREINNTEQTLVQSVRDNPELFSIVMRSSFDWNSIGAREQARAHLYFYSYTRWLETCWNLCEQNALDRKIYKSRELFIVGLLGNPKGGRLWWSMWQSLFDPDFSEHLDQALEAHGSDISYVHKAPFYAPEHWAEEDPPHDRADTGT